MKHMTLLFITSVLLLASCRNATPQVVINTVEVTKIVQVTTTSIPAITLTPSPTLSIYDESATRVAVAIGTPIKATYCYELTDTQRDLDNCSNQRRIELEQHMSELVQKVGERYSLVYGESNPFREFQMEWEDFVRRECEFRSGHTFTEVDGVSQYVGGSMALTGYNECLIGKYEDRLRELQIQLYELSI